MKTVRFISVMMVLLLLALPVFANGQTETTSPKVEEKVMTHDELVEAAKAEGTLTVYTYSSRTTKIGDAFTAKYGIPVEVTQLKDTEMIEKVSKEAAASLDAADVVFCQDGSRVIPELVYTNYVTAYIPENISGHIVDAEFENPLVFEAMPKVFIYNNEDVTEQPLTNIWQLTEPEWKGALQFK
ncbi:MAG: ABC transporter substrate-binding protein, partial [Spirochaetales bacterium]|nr:ABC transporter substrate-binding protein [Spirochaetales bacterium]